MTEGEGLSSPNNNNSIPAEKAEVDDETDNQFPVETRRRSSTTSSSNSSQPGPSGMSALEKKLSEEGEVTSTSGSGGAVEGGMRWLTEWNSVLLVACYLLAFIHTFAQLDFLPVVGILLAVLVFFAHLF